MSRSPAPPSPKSNRPARPPIVALKDVQLQDGAVKLFDGVDLGIEARSRSCLVGRNGAGKSTLMKLIAGGIEPDGGNRFVQPGLRFAFVPQEPVITGATVHEHVTSGGAEDYEADAALDSFGLDPAKSTQGPIRRRNPPRRAGQGCSGRKPRPDPAWTSPPTTWTSSPSKRWRKSCPRPRPPP